MKVTITRDILGCSIWYAEVIVEQMEQKSGSLTRKVWMNKNLMLFKKKKVFSDKYVKKNFPELLTLLKLDECKFYNLTLTPAE